MNYIKVNILHPVELCDGRVQMAYQIERTRDIIMHGHIVPNQRPVMMNQQPLWRPNGNKPNSQPKKKKNKKKVNYFV